MAALSSASTGGAETVMFAMMRSRSGACDEAIKAALRNTIMKKKTFFISGSEKFNVDIRFIARLALDFQFTLVHFISNFFCEIHSKSRSICSCFSGEIRFTYLLDDIIRHSLTVIMHAHLQEPWQ